MEKVITLPMVMVFVGAFLAAGGAFWTQVRANRESKLQIEKIQGLEKLIVDVQTIGDLMPGNNPDPLLAFQNKPPDDAIKLYLGSCLAWWKPNILHTYTLVNINNESVLKLSIDENEGLLISGKIRRENGKEFMTLKNNKFIRDPNIYHDFQRPNKHELIVSGESDKKLLHLNYLNEKTIAIEGTFYDSMGTWILTINESEIVDMDNNHMQGASFGGNENLFTYNTLLPHYQLMIDVNKPTSIDTGYRINYMHDGKIIEKPSEATITISNTGTEPIRLGYNGEMEVAISGQVLDLKISPPMEKSDYIELIGQKLKFTSLIINQGETKTINILMQGEGKCDISRATLHEGDVIVK